MHEHFFELVFSFSLDEYPEMELVDHMVVLVNFFKALPYCFDNGCTNLHS